MVNARPRRNDAARQPRARLARTGVAAIAAGLLISGGSVAATARRRATEIVDGRVAAAGEALVRYRSVAVRGDTFSLSGDVVSDIPAGPRWHLLRSGASSAGDFVRRLRARAEIVSVEPNYVVAADGLPNDLPSAEWALRNVGQAIGNGDYGTPGADINAPAAWDRTIGSRSTVVALIDSGVMVEHQDLAANIWTAPHAFTVTIGGGEVTCAAGTHGFNVLAQTCNPADDYGHGTHVAGVVAAVGDNGVGTVGVNWAASIMPIKFLDASGNGFVADAVNAIEFAIQARQAFPSGEANVRILNNSWNGAAYSQALADEIERARAADMLFVASAGNGGSDNGSSAQYPAGYLSDNVVSVAATDYRDQLASFSNYGETAVHIAAPGASIYSTYMSPSSPTVSAYATESGTSMAAGYVSGAAALVLSRCRYSTPELKSALLANAAALPGLQGKIQGGRRLDAGAAVASCDTSGSSTTESPYGTAPAPVPGTIRAENFDNGGEGVAYHDSSSGNAGAAYRSTDVDVEVSSEGAYDVGWTAPGEWLNYTVDVAAAGAYVVQARVASPSGGAFHIGFNGPSAGTWKAVTAPATGGWQNWTTVAVPVTLGAGTQQMTILFDTAGLNFTSATVVASGGVPASGPYSGTPVALPGTIEAANFDNGGEGVAYHDTTPSNAGGAYRTTDVDIEPASGGGFDVGWTAAGEWLNYTVTTAAAGIYTATIRAASPSGGTVHIGFNGPSNVWVTVPVPATGGWQNWTAIPVPVTLGKGAQQLTLLFDTGGTNLRSVTVTQP